MAENAGKLGQPLSSADSAAVVLKPMRPFSEGELCAARDPGLRQPGGASSSQQAAATSGTAVTSQSPPSAFRISVSRMPSISSVDKISLPGL